MGDSRKAELIRILQGLGLMNIVEIIQDESIDEHVKGFDTLRKNIDYIAAKLEGDITEKKLSALRTYDEECRKCLELLCLGRLGGSDKKLLQ